MMKKKSFLFFCLISASLFGQEIRPETPDADQFIDAAGSPRVSVERGEGEEHFLIEGVTLVSAGMNIENLPREHGISLKLGGKSDPHLVRLLRKFLNRPLTDGWVTEIKKSITDYFKTEKGTYVAVLIPVQEVIDGVVILQLLQGKVDEIHFTGQRWFSQNELARILQISPGDPLNEERFLNQLIWLNRNPFRSSQMVFVPSSNKEETDILVITKDRLPLRLYAGTDNTGFQANGQNRMYGGLNWGDAFFRGDLFSYQYTASPNMHNFQSHVASYTCYLPWQHALTLFGCYGTVFPNTVQSSGKNAQGSARYLIPIRPLYGAYLQETQLGFDYKYLTSNYFYSGSSIQSAPPAEAVPGANPVVRPALIANINNAIAISQFLFSYRFQRIWSNQALDFNAEMYVSFWKNGFPHQTSQDYNNARPYSHVRYAYWKFALSDILELSGGWTMKFFFRGQVATRTIPVSEQFGLGGYDTVRGYFEQQFVADNMVCLNGECYTPNLSFKIKSKIPTDIAFLAFVDYAYGYNYSALSSPFIRQNLLGIGPGIRLSVLNYIRARLDYGFQAFGIPDDSRLGRVHFSVVMSY